MRQSIYIRLAGYEDTNDAERLSVDPAMRQIVVGRAKERAAASTSLMGRFETETLTQSKNLQLSSSVVCISLQSWQFLETIGFAKEDKGMVAQDASSETDKDWCQSSETFEICDISDGRGDGIKVIVP